jgi:hydrogenase expression/formation protein HypE
MAEVITLNHGSGGRQTQELIMEVFAAKFGMKKPLTDSAVLDISGRKMAFTTDSYVIDPVFFPGGDIGKLAICGTVNDLAVSGAIPQNISVSFIIEDGFPLEDLIVIADSIAAEAERAGVRIVTGDTKVVEKGKCDRIFINTSGTGVFKTGTENTGTGERIMTGDRLIINGPVGNHAIAVLGARKSLSFSSTVISDCASLNHLIRELLDGCPGVHFMRDLTRGGLAAVLNELAEMTGKGIIVEEEAVPVDEPVKGICEILGFDPLSLANEGKVLIAIQKEEQENALRILRRNDLGKSSAVIGEIVDGNKGSVVLNTLTGGRRILEMPSGTLLPRIC